MSKDAEDYKRFQDCLANLVNKCHDSERGYLACIESSVVLEAWTEIAAKFDHDQTPGRTMIDMMIGEEAFIFPFLNYREDLGPFVFDLFVFHKEKGRDGEYMATICPDFLGDNLIDMFDDLDQAMAIAILSKVNANLTAWTNGQLTCCAQYAPHDFFIIELLNK